LRVLLINSNVKDDLLAAPPLGLCYVADAAEAAGYEVRVLDLCFSGRKVHRRLEEAIRSFGPEVIGISIRNIDNVNMLHPVSYLPGIVEFANEVRRWSRAPLVVGGSGASLIPEAVLKNTKADFIVVSDGEESFVSLLQALEAGNSADRIPGVGTLVNGRFHLSEPRLGPFKRGSPHLGKWVDIQPYQRIGSSYNIQTKRGCRGNCIYCTYNQNLEGNILRLRAAVDVVDEIEEALYRHKPNTFEFVDSVFNDPLAHSAAILEEIARRPWKAEFTAMGVNPQNLDREYLDLMWRAGFRSFMITPESASDTMLRNYRKGFSKEDVVAAAEAINKTAFAAWWFFMIGGPGETNETLGESLDFVREYLQKKGRRVTNVAHFFVGVRVYPGTSLWDQALYEGLIRPDANPAEPLWYLSQHLNLDRVVEQISQAAAECPEMYLGFDERVLSFSKAASFFFELFRFPRPYWRYYRAANVFGLKTGIRFMYRPSDIPRMLTDALKRQGYVPAGAGQDYHARSGSAE